MLNNQRVIKLHVFLWRWEPCGLVQMEAMRLGTLPIVAPTGGLKDTVEADWGKGGGKRCANLKSLVVLRWFNHVPEMVNVYITMGNQFFLKWVNPRTKWTIFNSKLLVYQRVTIQFTRILAIWWFNTSTNWTFFFGDDQDERDSDFGSCKGGIEISPSTSWGLNGGITNNWWFNKVFFLMFTGSWSDPHLAEVFRVPKLKTMWSRQFFVRNQSTTAAFSISCHVITVIIGATLYRNWWSNQC